MLVVDASVAVKFLVREDGNDRARALLSAPDPLIAPDWLLIEAASAFWKKVKRSELLEVHAARHLEDLPRFFQRLHPTRPLLTDALGLAFRLRHPVYDCIYVALAVRENCMVATADDGLAVAMERSGLAARVLRI